MLFKAYPGTDLVKVIWMIPARELWSQYAKGLVTENKTVYDSIQAFKNHRNTLEEKEADDMTDKQVDDVYKELSRDARSKAYRSQVAKGMPGV